MFFVGTVQYIHFVKCLDSTEVYIVFQDLFGFNLNLYAISLEQSKVETCLYQSPIQISAKILWTDGHVSKLLDPKKAGPSKTSYTVYNQILR